MNKKMTLAQIMKVACALAVVFALIDGAMDIRVLAVVHGEVSLFGWICRDVRHCNIIMTGFSGIMHCFGA